MKYDYSKIEDYSMQINNIKIDMQKQIELVRNIINQINSSWTGSAADYYIKESTKYFSNIEEFLKELDACTSYLRKCSDSYENLDRRVKQDIDNIISESKIFS